MSNCYLTQTPVYGRTRYGKKYLKIGQRRLMIFLSNEKPPYEKRSFDERFNVIEVHDPPNPLYQPIPVQPPPEPLTFQPSPQLDFCVPRQKS